MYLNGLGVEQNFEEARSLLAKGCEKGEPTSAYTLGTMYERGKGVEHNDAMAFKYFLKAAMRGFPYAQFNCGVMLMTGRAGRIDYVSDYILTKMAAEAGIEGAQENLRWLEPKMDPMELRLAREGDMHIWLTYGDILNE